MNQICNSKIYQFYNNDESLSEFSMCEFPVREKSHIHQYMKSAELDKNNINLYFVNKSNKMTIEEIINVIDELDKSQENLICKKMTIEN